MAWLPKGMQNLRSMFTGRIKRTDETVDMRDGTAEFELYVAKAEIENENGDLVHGFKHLCNLISYAPGHPDFVEILENYLDRLGDEPTAKLPREDRSFYTIEAARAYAYAKRGRLEDAIRILNAVVTAKPDSRYMEAWGLKWLEKEGAFESLSRESAVYLLGCALNRFPDYRHLTAQQRKHLLRYIELAERFNKHFETDRTTNMTYAGLLRKCGRLEEALSRAQDMRQRDPGWHSAIANGLTLREMRELSRAEAAFREALDFKPDDVAARMEAADMYFNAEEWEKANEWYEDVLASHPRHEWANPSSLFCLWKLKKFGRVESSFADKLLELAKGDPPSRRAHDLCNRLSPYIGFLPVPEDATANWLRQKIREEADAPGQKLQFVVDHLEAPSNSIAARLQFGSDREIDIKTEFVPEPDPREPLDSIDYKLWAYKGTVPRPALSEPPDEVLEPIAEIAKKRYDYREQYADASRVAEKLTADRATEILAVMVHPPALPAGHTALEWVPRVQLAVAQTLAHLDDGWEHSVRRKALYSALLGPRDWITTAAIVALAQLAAEEEIIAPDVHEAFTKLSKARPKSGFCCYEYALYYNWGFLPHLFPNERERLRESLKKLTKQ